MDSAQDKYSDNYNVKAARIIDINGLVCYYIVKLDRQKAKTKVQMIIKR